MNDKFLALFERYVVAQEKLAEAAKKQSDVTAALMQNTMGLQKTLMDMDSDLDELENVIPQELISSLFGAASKHSGCCGSCSCGEDDEDSDSPLTEDEINKLAAKLEKENN